MSGWWHCPTFNHRATARRFGGQCWRQRCSASPPPPVWHCSIRASSSGTRVETLAPRATRRLVRSALSAARLLPIHTRGNAGVVPATPRPTSPRRLRGAKAFRPKSSVARVIKEGKVGTFDLGGKASTLDVGKYPGVIPRTSSPHSFTQIRQTAGGRKQFYQCASLVLVPAYANEQLRQLCGRQRARIWGTIKDRLEPGIGH